MTKSAINNMSALSGISAVCAVCAKNVWNAINPYVKDKSHK